MDLIKYIHFYYFNTNNPEWFINRSSDLPKPFADIVIDIALKICFSLICIIALNLGKHAIYFLKNKFISKFTNNELIKHQKQSEDETEDQKESKNESKDVDESQAQGETEVLFKDEPQVADKPQDKEDVPEYPRAN